MIVLYFMSESWNQAQMMKVLHWYWLADLPSKRLLLAIWKQTISRYYPSIKDPEIQNGCDDFSGSSWQKSCAFLSSVSCASRFRANFGGRKLIGLITGVALPVPLKQYLALHAKYPCHVGAQWLYHCMFKTRACWTGILTRIAQFMLWSCAYHFKHMHNMYAKCCQG